MLQSLAAVFLPDILAQIARGVVLLSNPMVAHAQYWSDGQLLRRLALSRVLQSLLFEPVNQMLYIYPTESMSSEGRAYGPPNSVHRRKLRCQSSF